ncbi:MAG: nucleotidyltransferase [Cyanobacteria bacterium MAG CAR1_bin_15]|nr:nucleotidyltransferase [Cyanobacteria bacterium MAG CAR1_bin_15]
MHPLKPLSTLAERFLASVAVKIELLPSQQELMVQRKQAIESHLQRNDSQLKDRIRIFYQQGSVAIGATIKAKFRDEGFDIDIIAELDVSRKIKPAEALDLLYEAMRGKSGSRYYECTERQTRCVTISYKDGMHIDLSPSILLDPFDPRKSNIFHSKPEEPRSKDTCILTNSYAFAEYYKSCCPVDQQFVEEYSKRVQSFDQILLREADSVPVPDHSSHVGGKSAVTVALQLLKRNRIIKWRSRKRRMPASVMLSCLALEVAEAGRTIGENLKIISVHILKRLLAAKDKGELISVENPRCQGDYFTDRWPKSQEDQNLMINDMELFLWQLDIVLDEQRSFQDRTTQLKKMFGESVGQQIEREFSDEVGKLVRSGKHHLGRTGGILTIPTSVSAKPAAPSNTFYCATNLALVRELSAPPLALQAQVNAMAQRWPQFQVSRPGDQLVIWSGNLQGLERSFYITIEYGTPKKDDQEMYRLMPVVRVQRPSLVLNPDAEEEAPLPHVYPDTENDYRLSPLCLFDPATGEWNHSMKIADTTVPWTVRWLACYEIWEATGRWVGGGRHDSPKEVNHAA